jgi:hypothetical protein
MVSVSDITLWFAARDKRLPCWIMLCEAVFTCIVCQEIAYPGASRRGMTTESHEFLSYSQDKRSVHGQCRNGSPPDGCTSYEVDALPAKVFMPGMPSRVIQSDFAAAVWIDGALTGGLTQRT